MHAHVKSTVSVDTDVSLFAPHPMHRLVPGWHIVPFGCRLLLALEDGYDR